MTIRYCGRIRRPCAAGPSPSERSKLRFGACPLTLRDRPGGELGSVHTHRDLGPVPTRANASPPGPVPLPACAQEQMSLQPMPLTISDLWVMVSLNAIASRIETWKTQAQFVEKIPAQHPKTGIIAQAFRFCSDFGMITFKSRSHFALVLLRFCSCFIRLVGRFA